MASAISWEGLRAAMRQTDEPVTPAVEGWHGTLGGKQDAKADLAVPLFHSFA